MRYLFALTLLISPISRFPGFFFLVSPAKSAVFSLTLGTWYFLRRRKLANTWPFSVVRAFSGASSGASIVTSSGAATPAGAGHAKPPLPSQRWLELLFVILALWICITSVLSSAPISNGINSLLAHLTVFAFFFAFLEHVTSDEREPWWLVRIFLLIAAGIGSLAILQYVVMQFGVMRFLTDLIIPKLDRDLLLGPDAIPLPSWGYRSWGPFHHPNMLGLYLALAFPVALVMPFAEKQRRFKIFAAAAALLIFGGIFSSGSRGSWLNIAVASSVLLLPVIRRLPQFVSRVLAKVFPKSVSKGWLLAPVGGLAVVGVVFHQQIWQLLFQYFRLNSILSNREIIWQNSWTMVKENPIFGTGPGTFSRLYLDRFDFPSEIERGTAMRELASFGEIHLMDHWHAHNLYLHSAAEMGLLGAFLVVMMFVVYFREFFRDALRRGLRIGSLGSHGLLAWGCSAAILGNLVHGLTETTLNFSYPSLGVPFIFIFALGFGAMQQGRSMEQASSAQQASGAQQVTSMQQGRD
ncbi:MAG: O-antigen ligase family protein [Acidobacteriota bacterium]